MQNRWAQFMKKHFLTLLVFILVLSCGTKSKISNKTKLENGWYFITEEQNDNYKILDKYTDNFVFIEKQPIITSNESIDLKIEEKNWGGKEVIIIQMIYEGESQMRLADATERMYKNQDKAVFVFNDEYISTVSSLGRIDNGHIAISNQKFTQEVAEKILKELKLRL